MSSKVADHRHRNANVLARLMHSATSSNLPNLSSLLTNLTTASIKLTSVSGQPPALPLVGPLCTAGNSPSATICMPLLLPESALSVTISKSASSSPHQASPSGSPLASDSSIKSVSSSSASRSPGFPSTVGISGLSSSSKGGGPAFVGQVFSMCDLTGTGLMAVSTHIEIPFISKRMKRVKEVYGVINFTRSLHSSTKLLCSTRDIVLCPDINVGGLVNPLTPICSVLEATPKSSGCLEEFCQIVSSGIGSLDDLELSLDCLGPSIITSDLVTKVIGSCKCQAPTRRLLRFLLWARKNLKHEFGKDAFNHAIQVFAERKDLTALDILISDLQKEQGTLDAGTFSIVAEAFVKLGREDKALGLFKNLEKFKCSRDRNCVSAIVHALCAKGHARKAEGVVWHHKGEIFGIEACIYKSLLHGWFVNGNVKEARRIIDEMKCLGVPVDLFCYNTYLRCLCKRNLKFNPSVLVTDAFDLIVEMKSNGTAPNVVSFNILLSCLGRSRRVKEAYRVLYSMKNSGCPPDCVSYYLVVRVLYLSGRFGMGNRIVDEMIEEGLVPEPRLYHDLIGVLCGVERLNHALNLFEKMKKTCLGEFGATYDLLILKLCKCGDFEKGKQIWDEANRRGIVLQCSKSVLDPSITKVFRPTKRVDIGSK